MVSGNHQFAPQQIPPWFDPKGKKSSELGGSRARRSSHFVSVVLPTPNTGFTGEPDRLSDTWDPLSPHVQHTVAKLSLPGFSNLVTSARLPSYPSPLLPLASCDHGVMAGAGPARARQAGRKKWDRSPYIPTPIQRNDIRVKPVQSHSMRDPADPCFPSSLLFLLAFWGSWRGIGPTYCKSDEPANTWDFLSLPVLYDKSSSS